MDEEEESIRASASQPRSSLIGVDLGKNLQRAESENFELKKKLQSLESQFEELTE